MLLYRAPYLVDQTCTVTAVGLHRSKVVTSIASATFHRLAPQASQHGDDGATLYVGGRLVVDNDGLNSLQTKPGVAALAEGAHPIEVRYFNKTGGAVLDLRCGRVGQPLRQIDVNQLGHQPP